jgi:hypothetical protein
VFVVKHTSGMSLAAAGPPRESQEALQHMQQARGGEQLQLATIVDPEEFLSALPPMSLPLAPNGVPTPCWVEHVA